MESLIVLFFVSGILVGEFILYSIEVECTKSKRNLLNIHKEAEKYRSKNDIRN